MKKKICVLILILAVLLCGCDMQLDDSAIRQETEVVLEGLIAGDYDAVRGGLSQRVADADLAAAFDQLSRDMNGLGAWEMNAQGRQVTVRDGLKLTYIRYLVTAGQTQFYIDVTKVDGEQGIAGFHVSPAESPEPEVVSAGAIGWVITGLGIAAWGFTLWMAVDCLRRRMKLKWLWLLMILLLWMVFSMSLIQDIAKVNFNFGIRLGLSGVRAYADGSRMLSVYLPVGAVSYFCTRKKLTIQTAAESVEPEA